MKYSIRDASPADMATVWALNQSEVPHVGSVTLDEMRGFLEMAAYFRLAVDETGSIIAMLVGLAPGADYDSPNYRWFSERFDRFAYIDRVAVDSNARRLGIAHALYEDFARAAGPWSTRLCCEVNLEPPNPESMAFHLRIGFTQTGSLESPGGGKKVAMLVKTIT
jgi:predicted GNAT superfamily acetyltransferase